MNRMTSYLLKTAGALTVIALAHVLIVLEVPAIIPAEYWMRETITVKKSLAESLPSPRIFFLAGSSALFGVDAKAIEKSTGIFTINLGLQANLQLARVLGIGESMARPGDIMVLALERSYYGCGQKDWSPWQFRNAIAWDRGYFDALPLHKRVWIALHDSDSTLMFEVAGDFLLSRLFPAMYERRFAALASPQSIMRRFRSGVERSNEFSYSAFNLDDRGDMLNIEGAFTVDPAATVSALDPSRICPETLDTLGQFVARMKAKGVRVIFSHEPYMIEGQPAAGWEKSEALFSSDIHSIGSEILEDRKVMFFPRSAFFNFFAHLNEAARERRAMVIAADLKRLGIYRK